MANLRRPSTSCQMYRPSLTDDDDNQVNNNGKNSLSRSYTFDGIQSLKQQPRVTKPSQVSPPVADQQQQRLGRSLLSNDNWRQETMTDVRLNSKVIDQSDQNILFGKGIDPLPHVREMLNELSNAEAFLYARQCRVVVAKLRLCWTDVNEEIKSLLKHKEYTEAAIEHIRKDLIINKESFNIRKKPKREAEPDGVDDILAAEKYHLTNIKKILELTCKNVVDHMQKLDEVRQRVTKIGKERSLVTELICQCLTSASRTFELARIEKLDNVQHRRPPITAPPRPSSAFGFRSFRSTNNNLRTGSSNSNSYNTSNKAESTLLDENGLPLIGHLLAFTPDVIQVFQDAAKLIEESREIKKQTINQIKDAFNDAKAYSLTVNQSIAQKLADIITLAQHLTISLGENMLAQNRAYRWYDLTMSAQRSNAGPLGSSYLKTSERLDRPIIRTFQRHPGNQVPEAQMNAKATRNLQQSANETDKQMKTLKIVGQRLQTNLIDKEIALNIDSYLLRRRRERSDHKWGVTKYVHV
ncbi:unnamed protein product [Rotaria sordida]|uniref:Uncharacterized protein n=1 Tax=Rotaria sordida TaxID=392033 RepID=A0A815I7K6_9BILA|nr:unnamed protein product [Rotaria sordida]CAF1364579.1 unnamed protein product [Rotaria sordida]CAF3666135.1 unnamed protein product [Rotaria sordida]CAF4170317.1 unnamed protein product [Rotaria sordida]